MDGRAVGQLQALGEGSEQVPSRAEARLPTPPSPGSSLLLPSGPIFILRGQTGSLHISLLSARPLSPWAGLC